MSERSYLLSTAHIRSAYQGLSPAERRVADYMLAHPQEVVTHTARTLAQELTVSTATIVRFCRSCGFSGLTDLKLSLQREFAALCPADNAPQPSHTGKTDSVSIVKQKVLGYHDMVIKTLLSNQNEEAYLLALDAIAHAGKLIIIGDGDSRCSAMCLFSLLTNLGINCETYMDSVFEVMKIDQLGQGDVVIGITFTGRMRNTLESMILAKRRGVTTIGIVGYPESPVMHYVDILLNSTNLEKDYYDSALGTRLSEIAVIEILTTLVSMKLNPPIRESEAVSLRRTDRQI